MSEYSDDDYDNEDDVPTDGPKALRDALAKEKKEKRDALKRLADLEAKFAEADKQNRATVLKESLTAAGGSAAAKVASFYPSDAEVTADAVKSWLEANKDVFNLGQAPAAEMQEEQDGEETSQLSPETRAYLEAQQRVADLEQDAVENPGDEAKLAEIDRIAASAKSMQELMDGYRKAGVPTTNSGYRRT